jgi:hypothetical protein
MKLFNNKEEQTSNDYYEAYKAELGIGVEENRLFSLNNFLKLEILAVAVGFIMLNQNSLTSEFKKMYTAENNSLPVSMQSASLDEELVVTLEDDENLNKIAIREDTIVTEETEDKEALVDNGDLKLLIELLKTEIKENEQAAAANRIIISQK